MALVLVLPQSAAAGPTLWDPDYAYRPARQRDSIRRRVRQILAPTMTFPALVGQGGRFQIVLKVRRGLQRSRLGADRTASWVVELRPARSRSSIVLCEVAGSRIHGDRLELAVKSPILLARDVYDIAVMGPGVDDSQPNAVRILGDTEPAPLRFAVITDHQLWDPTAKIGGKRVGPGGFPQRGGEQENLAIARQALAELALWDVDFVLHLGDLVFGVNYPEEYDEAHALLREAALPLFAVPGNHDAYADYVVRLRGGALKLVAGALGCRRHLSGDLSWEKAWVFITCVYGDVKNMLYADLHRDGLSYWQRQLGPPAYAFDHGHLRFVGINTYDGTAKRRHAFSIYMDVMDLHLGAPAVDNYGGYLTESQLGFIKAQARLAGSNGQTLVVFGHHDPRGNTTGRRYHPNEPFPTDPIGLGGFEQWNYDSSGWDSDPGDRRGAEREQSNSGHALLRVLAEHGGYYLSGHVHQDSRRVYEPGSALPGGIRVKRRLEFITTTTASAAVQGDGYWGYRVIEVDGGGLRRVDFSPEHRLSSVPAGNLWLEHKGSPAGRAGKAEKGQVERMLVSGLPRPVRPLVRWELPTRAEGYRFRHASAGLSVAAAVRGTDPPQVEQVQDLDRNTVYWVRVALPAAPIDVTPDKLVRRTVRAMAARDNHPPRGVIDVSVAGGLKLQPIETGFDAAPGQPVLLSAERSTDAEGDRIISYLWQLGGRHRAGGRRVVHSFTAGVHRIRLTLVDEAGARSTVEGSLNIQPPKSPSPGCGCCASGMGPASLVPPGLLILALLLVHRWRQRRR